MFRAEKSGEVDMKTFLEEGLKPVSSTEASNIPTNKVTRHEEKRAKAKREERLRKINLENVGYTYSTDWLKNDVMSCCLFTIFGGFRMFCSTPWFIKGFRDL